MAVPFLATNFGWRSVAYVYGSVTALFAVVSHCTSTSSLSTRSCSAPNEDLQARSAQSLANVLLAKRHLCCCWVLLQAWHLCASEEPPEVTDHHSNKKDSLLPRATQPRLDPSKAAAAAAGGEGAVRSMSKQENEEEEEEPATPGGGSLRLVRARPEKTIEWAIFREPAIWSTFCMHLAENNSYYAM